MRETLWPAQMRGGSAQVFNAGVGAGADENAVNSHLFQGRACLEPHISESTLKALALLLGRRQEVGSGTFSVTGATMPGLVPGLASGRELVASNHQFAIELRA